MESFLRVPFVVVATLAEEGATEGVGPMAFLGREAVVVGCPVRGSFAVFLLLAEEGAA